LEEHPAPSPDTRSLPRADVDTDLHEAFWQKLDYVFCTLTGTHLRPNHLFDEFKKILKRAGLPAIRFHDLRHSTGMLLLGLGVHAKVVQEMHGHT
jgi:site-specific recombinase XerD